MVETIDLTVPELKDILQQKELNTARNNAELVLRVDDANP